MKIIFLQRYYPSTIPILHPAPFQYYTSVLLNTHKRIIRIKYVYVLIYEISRIFQKIRQTYFVAKLGRGLGAQPPAGSRGGTPVGAGGRNPRN